MIVLHHKTGKELGWLARLGDVGCLIGHPEPNVALEVSYLLAADRDFFR